MKCLFRRPLHTLMGVGVVALAAATPAQAAPTPPAQPAATAQVNASQCSTPQYVQPFLYAGDSNWYALVGGQRPDEFNGQGWQLSGGARIVSTTLEDGATGSVLDLPSGATATSPILCVTAEYPTARAIVRDVVGAEGVFFDVEYEGTNTWGDPRNTGQLHGNASAWTPVTPVRLQPSNEAGWQPMRITLVAGGKTSDFEVYDLYVDPRMH